MKSGEGIVGKGEFLGEKLRRVGKKGGHATPIAPFWRSKELRHFEAATTALDHQVQDFIVVNSFNNNNNNSFSKKDAPFHSPPSVSARKLGATLWEFYHYKLPLAKMHHGGGVPPPRLRRLNHHQGYKDKAAVEEVDPSPELPGSASSFRRHIAASLMQHHRAIDRSNHAMQPVSPASYGSSMEIAPYNPAITPTSSIEFKGRTGDTSYSLRTSTELLKVLNRIWSLEEQHVANTSLIKALKKELDNARLRVKELVREQHSDRREMDELMKQVTEDKLVRKNREQERISTAIQSMRDELEDERKLRKRSESLHRKLARELYDVKTTLAAVSGQLEKERKSRNVLEDLCDEFAWGIRDYEKEVHALRQVSDKDWAGKDDNCQLILHVSESWLDERMQMKLQNGNGVGEKKSALDKLRPEIEAFFETKRSFSTKINAKQVRRDHPTFRRSSLESIPLNMVVSAPQNEDGEDDSGGSDSNCFELDKVTESNLKPVINENKKNHDVETVKQKQVRKKTGSSERATGLSPSSLQVKFEEQMAHAMSHGDSTNQNEDSEQITTRQANPIETNVSHKPGKSEAAQENSSERKNETEPNPNDMIGNLIRNHYLLSESQSVHTDKDYGAASSSWRGHPSPVRQWTKNLPSHDLDISESSSKLPPESKQSTLMAKLFEARTRGQRSRAKASTKPSRNE